MNHRTFVRGGYSTLCIAHLAVAIAVSMASGADAEAQQQNRRAVRGRQAVTVPSGSAPVQPVAPARAQQPAPVATDPAPVAAVPTSTSVSQDVAVDLSKPETTQRPSYHRTASSNERLFKVLFDLSLYSLSDYNKLTFANFHSYLFLDIIPNKDVQFAFDVSSSNGSPSFFELDWRLNRLMQLRLGKIWIPFDDLSPHNLFGGRINVSALDPDELQVFLPDLWTELGVGMRFDIMDSADLQLIAHAYVTNGFTDGAPDPTDPTNTAKVYPSFAGSGITARDNNQDKALGGRIQAKIGGGKLNLGGSIYTARWNDDTEAEALRMLILGVDVQLKLKIASIRAGASSMKVDIPQDKINRGGFYGEFGIPVNNWTILARGGSRQLDDRIVAKTDRTIVGGALMYRPNFIQWSAEYSVDIKDRPDKKGEKYFALRSVIEL